MHGIDVLALGELNPDLILSGIHAASPVLGTEQEIDACTLTLGSATALCLVALARLGLRTALVARVGDDAHGSFCLARLAAEGIDATGVIVDPMMRTGLTVSLAYPADRLLLTLPGTMRSLTSADVSQDQLRQARHLHVSSFFLQEGLHDALADLFAAARAQGITTSLDTGWDPRGIWMSRALRDTLAQTDVFLPNESEFTAIGDSADPDRAARTLLATGVGRIAVKRGAAGATLYTREGVVTAPGFPVQAIDTTGAGDSFNGGFLAGCLAGLPPENCLRLGNACGAMTARVVGGVGGYANWNEVEAFMAQTPSVKPSSP
jgi:sugar/nucleoside kinase (ribokinase family)